MDLNKLPIMDAIIKRMGWLSHKQTVLSENVANANTPGYEARTVAEQDFKSLLDHSPTRDGSASAGRVSMSTTHKAHMGANGAVGGADYGGQQVKTDKVHFETSPSGNSVVLEEQMMDMTATQMEYGMMVNLYRKNVGLLKTAIGRGQR